MKNNRSLRNIPLWKLDSDKQRIRIRPMVRNLNQKDIFQLKKISARARKDFDFELMEKVAEELKTRIKSEEENTDKLTVSD